MNTENAANLSEFDILQLDRLDLKAEHEGSLDYAVENWTWPFDDPTLSRATRQDDVETLKIAIQETRQRRMQWWREHPHPTQIAPLDAHEAEAERRERESE